MSKFEHDLSAPDDELGLTQPEGYLLSGEALRNVTLEQVRDKLGELGLEPALEITPVAELATFRAIAECHEDEPEPVPMTRADFRRFASDHGYEDRRATNSWHYLGCTSSPHLRPHDEYSKLRWLGSENWRRDMVDLRSVQERLLASGLRSTAWYKGTPEHVRFLAHMVNEVIKPDEPLPLSYAGFQQMRRNR